MQTLAHIIYSGIVQGVGFRFTAQRFAISLNLSGWVKNLADGRVEIMAEGSQEKINQLIKDLDQHFDGSIHDKHISYQPATGQFKEFTISH